MADQPEYCSQCGRGPFKSIFSHWSHPNVECSHPTPTAAQQDVLRGLWLSGAAVLRPEAGKYPSMQKQSTNRQLLEHLYDALGMWSASTVSETKSATERSEKLRETWGEDGNVGEAYVLHTRAFPYIGRFIDRSLHDVELTPGAARVLYGFRGRVSEDAVRIVHPRGDELAALLSRTGFEAAAYDPPEGNRGYRVRIGQEGSRAFAQWIRAAEPLPGCEGRFADLWTVVEGA